MTATGDVVMSLLDPAGPLVLGAIGGLAVAAAAWAWAYVHDHDDDQAARR